MTDETKPYTDADLDELRRWTDAVGEDPELGADTIASLVRDLREARRLLRKIEWVQHSTHDEGWAECEICGAEGRGMIPTTYEYMPGKHHPGCELAAFLGGPETKP